MQLHNPAIKGLGFFFFKSEIIATGKAEGKEGRVNSFFFERLAVIWNLGKRCFFVVVSLPFLSCLFDKIIWGFFWSQVRLGTVFPLFYRGSLSWFCYLLGNAGSRQAGSWLIRTKAWKLSHLRTSLALSLGPLRPRCSTLWRPLFQCLHPWRIFFYCGKIGVNHIYCFNHL